ncbi:epidermal growth factor receptor kinase substrate 8-like isoform X2 [Mytilus californianus]|uniref:epidermal growth factor receptor kinase substrate 8-like isoform X2 n=1 Tax=Mytilus californianus TaxID=6549 RepID=UPI0022451BDC|nr:epidermal growth factor receptor kinase substrate 8-like isoform X2 [Mytilus californianus]
MPGVTPQGMDYHHNYGGMNGHGSGGYGYGPSTYNSAPPLSTYRESEFGLSERNGYGGPEIDQHSMDRFDNTRDMEPTFELDHLATYSSKSGVMKPEDGLRKLRGMESTTGIWTMRCVMIIERKNLIVIDKGNGEELERFPLELVHEPTAIFKEDKREVYTNLILFTMLENPGKYNSRCDMHIFQSINAPAQDIVDELLAAKEGRPKLFSSSIPPPPMGPAPDPPEQSSRYQFKTTTLRDEGMKSNSNGLRLQNEGFRVIPSSEGFRPPSEGYRTQSEPFRSQNEGPRGDMYSLPMRDKDSVNSRGGNYGQSQYRASYTEPPGGQNESLERDVQILNSCFDDIEKFVARLQQAAEAYKELENRKRERQSHKKKNDRAPPPRDGMLNMRARPPPGDDFIDIFQKIKCAFNLLSKLKAHIHDPNAPELVHFIFTPLSLIYEASRDPVHVGVDLASKAVSPLLTREAKELLLNCLTSKELELWQLLGRNWTTSEDEMQSTQRNLFKPTIDKSQLEQSLANHKHQIEENTRAEEARFQSQQMIRQLPPPREEPRDDYRATKDDYRATRDDYRATKDDYRSTAYGRTLQEEPSYSRTRREEEPSYNTGPIGASSRIGQSFRPEEDDHYRREPMYDRKHPSTPPPGAVTNPNVAKYQEYVEKHIDRNQDAHRYPGTKSRGQENQEYKEELRRKNAKIYEAVHERTGRNQKEITVEKGDILEVLDDSRNWWRLRNYKGDSGYAPYTILRDAGDDRNDIDRNGGRRGSIGGYSGNINQSNHIPVAPPPPRKEEEEFVREIKPSRHQRNDSDGRSDGSDRNRQGRRQDKRSSSSDPYGSRDDTPDSSDADNFSGSYDGSIEDKVERRRSNNRKNERPTSYKPGVKNRNSSELKRAGESRGYQNRSFEEEPNRHRTRTPPPPPSFVPPPPPANRPPSAGKKYHPTGQANKRQQDQLHNELSQRLAGKPAVKSKPQNQNVYLSTKSSAKEVVDWLYSKSFSQKCIDVLRGYNGHDLLRMKMKDLERLISHDEAQRLDGHLTLQKNMSGYKTQGPKELQAILQQRKQKADTHDDDVGRPPSFAPDSPDYSDDNSEASEEDFGNAGKTLRALLQHQRKKITSYRYEQ